MPVTLQEYQNSTQDSIQQGVIEEFRKVSYLMDKLSFDRAVAPVGNGKTLTFGYNREKTLAAAAFRALNSEYTPSESTTEQITGQLKIFGGKSQIDRVLSKNGGLYDEMDYQIKSKVKSAVALFNDTFINGDTAQAPASFDGIDVAIAGSSTDYAPPALIDISTAAQMDANYKAFLDAMDEFLALLNAKPTALFMNTKLLTKFKQAARRAGYYTRKEDAFGKTVDAYDDIALIDLGEKVGGTLPVVPIYSETVGQTTTTGLTNLYAAVLEPKGAVNAVTTIEGEFIRHYLPDMNTPGAVKDVEVEAIAAIAVQATKSAGCIRGIKVA
jgi:hypothetical protein